MLTVLGLVTVHGTLSTRRGNFTPTPTYTPKVACLNFGVWGRVLDVINHAKF